MFCSGDANRFKQSSEESGEEYRLDECVEDRDAPVIVTVDSEESDTRIKWSSRLLQRNVFKQNKGSSTISEDDFMKAETLFSKQEYTLRRGP